MSFLRNLYGGSVCIPFIKKSFVSIEEEGIQYHEKKLKNEKSEIKNNIKRYDQGIFWNDFHSLYEQFDIDIDESLVMDFPTPKRIEIISLLSQDSKVYVFNQMVFQEQFKQDTNVTKICIEFVHNDFEDHNLKKVLHMHYNISPSNESTESIIEKSFFFSNYQNIGKKEPKITLFSVFGPYLNEIVYLENLLPNTFIRIVNESGFLFSINGIHFNDRISSLTVETLIQAGKTVVLSIDWQCTFVERFLCFRMIPSKNSISQLKKLI